MELTPEPLPARGDLSRTPFAILLAHARALGTTGILSLRDDKKVFLARGSPVRVESSIPVESSEAYLLEKGVVTAPELAQLHQFAVATGQGLSDALVSLGLVNVNDLFEYARDLTRQRVLRCFELEEGAYTFERLTRLTEDFLPVQLDVTKVFVEGITLYYGRRRLDEELPIDDDWCLYIVNSPLATASAKLVDTVDARLLKLATSSPSLRSITISLPLTAERLRQRLYVLYCLGVLGFGARESLPPPRLSELPRMPTPLVAEPVRPGLHRRILTPFVPMPAVKPPSSASPDAARPAGPSQAPDRPDLQPRVHAAEASEPRPETAAQPAAVRPAFGPEHISTIASYPPPPAEQAGQKRADPEAAPRGPSPSRTSVTKPAPRPRTVEQLLEDAEFARMSGEIDRALDALREARKIDPQSPRVMAEFALALLISDPRKYAKEANRLAREARHVDPRLPLPYVVLGILMEQLGDPGRAGQLYRYATTLDRDCQEAQRHWDDLEQKQSGRG